MSTQIIGYFILFGFGALFLGISTLVSKRYSTEGVDDLVAAGRSMPFGMIAASSMVSWVWTITLIGSAEAGFVFGINGGFNYAWGAAVPFFVFIPVVLTLRKKMPKCTTFVEFIHERYGDKLTIIFIIFAVLLSMYILLSQGMGVGIAISYITGIPYKIAVAVPLLIVGLYISKAGLRGSMFNDLIQFFIIGLVLLIIVPVVLKNIGLANMFDSLMDVSTNPSNPNYNPNALNFFSGAGMRYGVVALVVALGQVLLDQGYYSKAVSAASTKTLFRAYLIGTIVAWAPIAIICGNVLGGGGLAMGATVGTNLGVSSDVAPFIIESFFGTGLGAVMYLMMIFMAGMTTGGGVLAGVQAISTIDLYKRYIKKDSTEKQQTRFGKRVTLAVSAIMAIVVMFFENASLLQVDIFSGIIFAAPCSAFVAGLIWKKVSAKVAGASIFIGMICGIIAYFAIPDNQINYFVGNLCSLLMPAIVIIIASLTSKYEFDWQKLEKYNPAHEVNISNDQ